MRDMHIYSEQEYELERQQKIIKNITKPLKMYDRNKSSVIKNYIYYAQSVRVD